MIRPALFESWRANCAVVVVLALAISLPGLALAQDAAASPVAKSPQAAIRELVAAGATDIDQLVAVIASDNREALDHIVINLATQTLYECNIDGHVLEQHKISSGRKGFDTPPGEYKVINKAPKAYSKKYEAWMLYWMGLTSDGSYGMHGLEGSSYERLLGNPASHGCVRLSRDFAKQLYPRVQVGMPVTILNDAKLDLKQFEPMSKQEAIAVVLDAISPADPWEVYY